MHLASADLNGHVAISLWATPDKLASVVCGPAVAESGATVHKHITNLAGLLCRCNSADAC